MDSSLSIELKRKGIHLVALIIPIGLFFFPEKVSLPMLFAVTAWSIFVDAGRGRFPVLQRTFLRFFSPLLRDHETSAWTGSTFLLLSSSLCALFFILIIGEPRFDLDARLSLYYAFTFLILGDAAAAVIGKTFGKRKIAGNKTLEGSLACVSVCLAWYALSRLWLPVSIGFALAACAALLTAGAEALPLKLDDNLRVAPACCLLIYCVLRWGSGA